MTAMNSREGIAARLREVGEDNNDWFMGANAAFFKIDDIIGAQYKSYGFFFNRLADLVDPTCHIVETVEDGRTMYVCSNCYSCKSEDKKQLSKFVYCPVCGARVVRDES